MCLAAVGLVGFAVRSVTAQPPAKAPPRAADVQDPFASTEARPEDAPDALFQIDAVVVTARRSEQRLGDSPVAVEVIDRAQIESSGARDAAQVLSTHPGLQIASSFAGGR